MVTTTVDSRLALMLADLIRPRMAELKKKYNVSSLAMFGSNVCGDQTPESDVDLLVTFDGPIGFFKFMELERELSNIIARKVDLVSREGIKPAVLERVKGSLRTV